MNDVLELGIVGMGPAGIGVATSIEGTALVAQTVCFERGANFEESICRALKNYGCCEGDTCHVISGIGGASSNSSGKISNYPAGSGLKFFFRSEQELTNLMLKLISSFEKDIELKKVNINPEIIESTREHYEKNGITYKYYDVYEFNGQKYRNFLSNTLERLTSSGLHLELNTEVTAIEYISEKCLYKITTTRFGTMNEYFCRNVVLSTGSMQMHDQILCDCVDNLKTSFEVGLRIEGRTELFQSIFATHGDLKLKYYNGRTYCVTKNGRIISYRTDGMQLLEGCVDPDSSTSYSNLAILQKCDNEQLIASFLQKYRQEYDGIPIKQRYLDYMNGREMVGDVFTTLSASRCRNITNLFPSEINLSIQNFLNAVLKESMHLDVEQLVIVAPEIKVLRSIELSNKFEVKPGLYIVGAASGKFRGILQSYCSGLRCGKNILGR